VHTSALDEKMISPQYAISLASVFDVNSLQKRFGDVVVSYVPGACSIRNFELSPQGVEWGLQNKDTKDRNVGWDDEFGKDAPILISEVYQGFWMIPVGVEWNLNFRSLQVDELSSVDVELGVPRPFYDQRHRPNHFLHFVEALQNEEQGAVDSEDRFV
jgi:pre-mRNA-processing factor 8